MSDMTAARSPVPMKSLYEQIEEVCRTRIDLPTQLRNIAKEIPNAIAQSIDGIKRVSSMISAMRDFSHIDERRFAPADLNKAVNSTIVILRNEIKYVADVETDLDDNLPAVMCCKDEVQQVFLNLIINAAHSIGDCANDGGEKKRDRHHKEEQAFAREIESRQHRMAGI